MAALSVSACAQVYTTTTDLHHCFYPENSFTVGGVAVQGLESAATGAGARVYYNMRENICVGPEFVRLQESHHAVTEMNLVVHYIIDVAHFGLYPVAGVGAVPSAETFKNPYPMAGIGLHRNIKAFSVFAEYDRLFVKHGNDKVAFGLLYMLKL